jgi:hypothetical protein
MSNSSTQYDRKTERSQPPGGLESSSAAKSWWTTPADFITRHDTFFLIAIPTAMWIFQTLLFRYGSPEVVETLKVLTFKK